MRHCFSIQLLITTVVLSTTIRADDWYRWRGPNLDGISNEQDWLDKWPASGPAIAWRAAVGTGYSSITVSKGRVFTIGNEDETDTVYCFDEETGKKLWTHSYESPIDARFFEGGPTSTPTIDGSQVYTLGRQGDLFCFDAPTGKVIWSKNIADETGHRIPGWGFSGSPTVHENLLLLNVGEAGTVVDKMTGKLIWTSANKDAGYSTLLPFKRENKWCAVFGSSKHYMAVEIETGKELWRHRWLTQFGVNAADAILHGDHAFISSGYNRGCALLKLGGAEPTVVWESKVMQNQMNSCVLIDGHLYGVDGDTTSDTFLKCLNYLTGEVKWSVEDFGSGSLMAAGDKLIALSERGELMVAPASPKSFEPIARAKVIVGDCWTVPVLSNRRIYCRNAAGDVVCVDVRK